MNPWQITWVWLLSLTLFFVANEARDFWDALGIGEKTKVKIYNDLQYGAYLCVHCKSKDDDLGWEACPYRHSYSFEFRPEFEFWGRTGTVFSCEVRWNGESHCFEPFNYGRYGAIFDRVLKWYVRPSGPCITEKHNRHLLCYTWDKYSCNA
ncbi:hypothetical protein V6N13_147929 [Hibiscus sabdariffa]|uniref:S-protein homolog n=1 Tax=Hibiscus sabdariffa TaxID=183260 RepID=A0ABR2TX06_9ROSI